MARNRPDGMAWVRLYTDFPRHPKTLRLMSTAKGREAVGIYAFALTWSGDQLTDGYIPDYVLPALHATKAHKAGLLWIRPVTGRCPLPTRSARFRALQWHGKS